MLSLQILRAQKNIFIPVNLLLSPLYMQNRYIYCILCLLPVLITTTAVAQKHKKPVAVIAKDDPAYIFNNPPEDAKPGVLWMWMGSNVSASGITKDLEALKQEGFNSVTMST